MFWHEKKHHFYLQYRLSLKTCELLWDATAAHLDRFAGDGLRTLCVAYKEIDSDYFALWQVCINKKSDLISF